MVTEPLTPVKKTRAPKLSSLRDPLPTAAMPAARAPRPVRVAGAPRPVRAEKVSTDNVDEQRVYHLTHISNLAAILQDGRLLADDALSTRPVVDISAPATRELRRAALVAGDGRSVAEYVPFFLSPNATVWESVRAEAADPRLALDAHGSEAFDFVMLVSTVKKINDGLAAVAAPADDGAPLVPSVVAVTNGDAAGALTRFGATPATAERMLQTLRAEADGAMILDAELLVPGAVPMELITLIGVCNDNVRETVRGTLKLSAFKPKVAVYPPWFHTSADAL
ncbi:DarT ssDNA thymidine ADP-ribosyltransferase family protein [Cryobacterium sp. PH31-L1]|uniref:DarT ssDNA thymidine ADP-ribosyltransferase family protein n=1 Tax=Cryobacterium sp. PH31-L1 TaxID=3046199 RepID=UPI0024BA6DBB|nr:DarT ssDNA thymidine ADP-ribosyltransferase family protein [Cryobacterium sp. PH31-L1]MDJ0376480.1 DarT ssDNA thymidine ADP-ribosyltransferase family protein [Cryobacterium sp. PH31-L1]